MTSNHEQMGGRQTRRSFLRSASLALGTCGLAQYGLVEGWAGAAPAGTAAGLTAADLPRGKAPRPKPIGKPAPEPQSKGSEVAPKGKPIERMNLAELRAVCSAEHIDMDGLNTRSDFVAIIKLTREEAAR